MKGTEKGILIDDEKGGGRGDSLTFRLTDRSGEEGEEGRSLRDGRREKTVGGGDLKVLRGRRGEIALAAAAAAAATLMTCAAARGRGV